MTMPSARYRGPPMTLADMRENGVRSLCVTCELCHHQAVMNVDAFDNEVTVPAFGPRMVCTSCGIIGAHTRHAGRALAGPTSPPKVCYGARLSVTGCGIALIGIIRLQFRK